MGQKGLQESVFLIQTPQQHFTWLNGDLCINSGIWLFSSFIRRCVTTGGYAATWRQTGVIFCQFYEPAQNEKFNLLLFK